MRSRPDSPRRQPNVLARAAGLATTALLAAAVLVGSGAGSVGAWDQGSAEATLWQLLNGTRANNGLNVLVQHGTLVSIARWRSADMVQRSYFGHTILGTGYQVYHWYDINGLAYSLGGENIAWNSGYADADSPVAAHNGFMNSAGHRANILRPGWTHGGVGAYAADGVMFLGSVRNPRVYTELFMTAAGGGGGGGGEAAAVAGEAVAAAAAGAITQPAPPPLPPREVPAPVRPSSTEPVDGSSRLIHTTAALPNRAWAGVDSRGAPAAATAAASLRVDHAGPADRGVFETFLGTLIGFLFG